MTEAGKLLMVFGLLSLLAGAAVWCLGRTGFRGLPGDIVYVSRNVEIYVPIASCVLLSLLLSAMVWLWQWLTGR
jgi:hypothetical protein